MQGKPGVRTAVIVLASALLLVSLIVLAYVFFADRGNQNTIVLPDADVQEPEQTNPPEDEEAGFASVNAQNVMDALCTLTPADAYHQVVSLSTSWQDGASERSVEIYSSSGITKMILRDSKSVKYYLTDGQTLYIWYDDDAQAAQTELEPSVSVDELAGIPAYMAVLRDSEVLSASFVSDTERAGASIYVRCTTQSGAEHQYWIDLESALLIRADILNEQQLTYQLQQQQLDLVSPGDSLFEGVFCLPDGTEPFGH